jgi:flagellar hook-basal body complex protein FliE
MNIPPTTMSGAGAAGLGSLQGSGNGGDFAQTLASAVERVNDLQTVADQKVTNLLTGKGEDVHAATLAVEQASLAFDLMLQVRNKVVGAYQEISKLQF